MRTQIRIRSIVTRFLERKKTTFTSPSGRATPPRQPPLPLCGRSCRNQLLPPRVSPPVAAPKNRVVRKRALVRASARLRALPVAGPQALQNHTALPGASAAHQGRCAARPLGRSRSQPPAESPARAREINYQVSDSGCVVTVRDTGVASLAPRTRIRETDSTHGGRRTLNVASPSHFAWLLIAPRHNTWVLAGAPSVAGDLPPPHRRTGFPHPATTLLP